MKIALYVEEGLEQIVLTPETEIEKGIIGKLHDGTRALEVYRGSFYACRGGWIRHDNASTPDSTMIILRRKQPEPSSDQIWTRTLQDVVA